MMRSPFSHPVSPNAESFIASLSRGRPERLHFIEIFLDTEVKDEICRRFGLGAELREGDARFLQKREIALQRFLGYDYVLSGPAGMGFDFSWNRAEDGSALSRKGGRSYVDETRGPIASWEEFEAYPWPDPALADTEELEWYEENLPDDMCVLGGLIGHIAEELTFFMGYETLCFALYDDPALVRAILGKVVESHERRLELLLQFERVKAVWGTDDMGFKTGPLLAPEQLRELVLPAHASLAARTHSAGRLYLLHSCGKLDLIMEDLIEEVGIDAKHSFEDSIEDVADAKEAYGSRIAVLGGIDLDFLCRSDEAAIRSRVRRTVERCGISGYCLGTGNSVANYVPVDSYLAMLDEGRRMMRP
jgi:uroporphyrinogen decarboxylase